MTAQMVHNADNAGSVVSAARQNDSRAGARVGLGLANIKSVADHHGGRVWCESAPGKGSAFYLALPLA
jgi:signal transduction histidine kinase